MKFVLNKAGLAIPTFIGQDGAKRQIRHANEFWENYGVPVHDECAQPGDLIFFSRRGDFPTHIGIVRDEESYIHAPGTSESKVEIKQISYAVIAKNSLRRQLYIRNPIGFKAPTTALDHPTYRYHQKPIE